MVVVSVVIIILFSVVLHEIGHGYAALRLGDSTARDMGRLTMNPISHIDPVMTIIIPVILALTPGMPIFGGAKPVPVQPHRFKFASPRRGMMLVAAAGPAVNLAIAIVALALIYIIGRNSPVGIKDFLLLTFQINIFLMAFNLLPIPPLDGSKVLMGFVSREWAFKLSQIEPYGFFILLGLLMFNVLTPFFYGVFYLMRMVLPGWV